MKWLIGLVLGSVLFSLAPAGVAHAGTREYCACDDVRIYSLSRYMKGPSSGSRWELECNNHGGHGYCSNNVDSGHGSGCGAMTGSVGGYLAPYYDSSTPYLSEFGKSCPDDHQTCFRGPSSCDNGGAWGNICNCDTWHSQSYNSTGAWWYDGLVDNYSVFQANSGWKLSGAACSNTYAGVQNRVVEHDPVCCDDPMGTLYTGAYISDGYGAREVSGAVNHCEDGTCGEWGATYRIEWLNCRSGTEYCGEWGEYCQANGDCCSGYCDGYSQTCY